MAASEVCWNDIWRSGPRIPAFQDSGFPPELSAGFRSVDQLGATSLKRCGLPALIRKAAMSKAWASVDCQ